MLILADENIPFAAQVLAHLGEVRTLPGRSLNAAAVREAELLLVRSVTQVNRALLEGSHVRFVATATIGTDHIDHDYLRARGIAFASAPGSNAQSVAEYVAAALLTLEARGLLRLSASTLGIVGVGNVGSRVQRAARTLGMQTLLNDPPRARTEGPADFVPLPELCDRAGVITFHVPLERGGADPTWHMLDARLIARLRPGTVVINSSRGGVHDTAALKEARRNGQLKGLVLDVFEGEPAIDAELALSADLASPHIAGYSYDGKVAGTRMIYEAACRFLGATPCWPQELPPPEDLLITAERATLAQVVHRAYDIEADDGRLRAALAHASPEGRAQGFDRLRREYPRRREFANWRVRLGEPQPGLLETLGALGFRCEPFTPAANSR